MSDSRDEIELLKRHIRAVISDPRADEKYIAFLFRKFIELRRRVAK